MSEDREEKELQELFSTLRNVEHLPVDVLLADARGKLSEDGHMRVEEHVKHCSECAEVLEFARECIQIEKQHSEGSLEVDTDVPISKKVEDKLEVYKLLCSKRDEIIADIAKLFLPGHAWDMITSTIELAKDVEYEPAEAKPENEATNRTRAAAFSSDPSSENEMYAGIIIDVISFVDRTVEMLLSRCEKIENIAQEINVCAKNSMTILDAVNLTEHNHQRIITLLVYAWSLN